MAEEPVGGDGRDAVAAVGFGGATAVGTGGHGGAEIGAGLGQGGAALALFFFFLLFFLDPALVVLAVRVADDFVNVAAAVFKDIAHDIHGGDVAHAE